METKILLQAYRMGLFPMASPLGEIEWFSPDPRGILPLDSFHIPHGLKRDIRAGTFSLRFNTRFVEVIEACAARGDTWINDEIYQAYVSLHRLGHAHSVETWKENKLAGGLYGVAIGGAFFGESMFHRVTNASKVALWGLVEHLRQKRFQLLDTQWLTPHLEQFGGVEIPRYRYLRLLERAVQARTNFV